MSHLLKFVCQAENKILIVRECCWVKSLSFVRVVKACFSHQQNKLTWICWGHRRRTIFTSTTFPWIDIQARYYLFSCLFLVFCSLVVSGVFPRRTEPRCVNHWLACFFVQPLFWVYSRSERNHYLFSTDRCFYVQPLFRVHSQGERNHDLLSVVWQVFSSQPVFRVYSRGERNHDLSTSAWQFFPSAVVSDVFPKRAEADDLFTTAWLYFFVQPLCRAHARDEQNQMIC